MEGLREETAEEWPPRAASRFARDDLLELKPNWTAAGPWLARSSLLKSSMDSLLLTIMCVVVSKDAGMKVSEEMWRGRECGIGWASVSGSWTSLSKMRESSARLLQLEREMEEAKENWSLSRDDFRLAPAAAAAAAAPAALLAVEALFWLPDVCLMKSSLSSVSWESFVLLLPSEIGEWIPRLEECAAAEPGLFGEAEPAAAEAPAAVFLLDDEDTEALDRLVKEKLLKSVAGAPWEAPLCALEPRLPSYSVDEGGENIALVSRNQLVCCVGMGGNGGCAAVAAASSRVDLSAVGWQSGASTHTLFCNDLRMGVSIKRRYRCLIASPLLSSLHRLSLPRSQSVLRPLWPGPAARRLACRCHCVIVVCSHPQHRHISDGHTLPAEHNRTDRPPRRRRIVSGWPSRLAEHQAFLSDKRGGHVRAPRWGGGGWMNKTTRVLWTDGRSEETREREGREEERKKDRERKRIERGGRGCVYVSEFLLCG